MSFSNYENYFPRENLIGITNETFTGRPFCLPGFHEGICLAIRIASSFKPFIPLTILKSDKCHFQFLQKFYVRNHFLTP